MDTKFQIDVYAFKTRVLPTVFAVAPLLVIGTFLIPSLSGGQSKIIGSLLGCAFLFLLDQLGRDRGKAIEPSLFTEWGGKPSVAMLRHRDGRVERHTKRRWRTILESKARGLVLATVAEEASSPACADGGYESATKWLLAQTRDPAQFRLLHAENANYGFRRNLLGLRPYALGMDAMCFVVLLAWWWLNGGLGSASELETLGIEFFVCLVAVLAHLGVMLGVVRSDWVRVVAEEYGHRLLACCDSL